MNNFSTSLTLPCSGASLNIHSVEITRIVKRFIWWPRKIKNKWKWLSVCYVKQKYKQIPFVVWNFEWINIEFLTQSEYLEWRIINE